MPDNVQLILGDCRDVLRELARQNGTGPRFTAIVTDPPAGIAFMGKDWDTFATRGRGNTADGQHPVGFAKDVHWDKDIRARDTFIEWMTEIASLALDLCLPGAHALVWALPRTSHWTATAWENGGWEVRDRIAHVFGSGFPKSLDVSKALDKAAGAEREVVGQRKQPQGPDSMLRRAKQVEQGYRPDGDEYGQVASDTHYITAPATDLAREWAGYGSALKPAVEDWWLLRKPLSGTIAGNCAEFGCGAINVDGARVGTDDSFGGGTKGTSGFAAGYEHDGWKPGSASGRFPANLITDGSAEVTACFPVTTSTAQVRHNGAFKSVAKGAETERDSYGFADTGSAARFFACCPPDADAPRLYYAAKASRREREAGCEGLEAKSAGVMDDDAYVWPMNGDGSPRGVKVAPSRNGHPTVKPLALMRYLLTLLRQPTVNLVLDPFMGSGSTGVACVQLGIPFVGIERNAEYFEIARRRISAARPLAAQPQAEQLELL